MRVTINDSEVNIPSSLSEITLQQKIDYERLHGRELDEMANSISEMPDDIHRENEVVEFHRIKMFRTMAFFSGFSAEALEQSEMEETITNIYYKTVATLFDDLDSMDLQREFAWRGELWYLHPPKLESGSNMKCREVTDAKHIVGHMLKLGANMWECMLPLCAVYLRRKDEEYQEAFIMEDSERTELMKELPMDIAMQVGFFLSYCQNIWINTFLSSGLQRSKQADKILKSISNSGAGHILLPQ